MDDGSWLSFLSLAVFFSSAFYFAISETAFASANKIKLKIHADRGDRRGIKAMSVVDSFDKAITTILIGTNISQISFATIATLYTTKKWGISAASITSLAVTMVIFFAAEMLPKSIAKKYSEQISMAVSSSLCFFMFIFTPFASVLTALGTGIAGLTKGDPEITVTEDELYDIIENMKDEGELGAEQGDLVHSALHFSDVAVETVLTARVDIAAISISDSSEDIVKFIKEHRHSRLPVYSGNIDNIIGILQIRKFLKAYVKNNGDVDLSALLDAAYFFHSSSKIDYVLAEMSKNRINVAVITDNYGGTLGIVTIEDILEELVGEIWDEDDDVIETFVSLPGGQYEVDAELIVEYAFELMGYDDKNGPDFSSKHMGEWTYEQFDSLPKEGDSFIYGNLEVSVSKMQQNRIQKLLVTVDRDGQNPGGENL